MPLFGRRSQPAGPLDGVDVVLADLDGVVYAGAGALPHAVDSLTRARDGRTLAYITNNASRTDASVAAHLSDLGLPTRADEVVTSPQAAMRLLATRVAPGSTILVVGVRESSFTNSLLVIVKIGVVLFVIALGVRYVDSANWTKVPVKDMSTFKGMKFRAYNAATSRLAQLMGASPTTVNSGDVPQAFGTGLIEAMITSPATGVDSQAWDFAKYYYDVQAFIPKNVTIVNERAFKRLSPAAQKAVMDAAAAAEKHGWEMARQQTDDLTQQLAKHGMVVGKAPAALEAELAKVGAVMADEWVKKAGPEGKAVLQKLRH